MKFFNNTVAFLFTLAILALYFVPRLVGGVHTAGYDHLVILFISLFLLATAFQNTSIHDKLSDVRASLSRAWLNIRRLQNENEGQNTRINHFISETKHLHNRLSLNAEIFTSLEKSVKRVIGEQNNVVNDNNEVVTGILNANRDLRDSIEDINVRIKYEAQSRDSGDKLLMSRIGGMEEAIERLKNLIVDRVSEETMHRSSGHMKLERAVEILQHDIDFLSHEISKRDPSLDENAKEPAYRPNYMESESWLKEISERLNEINFYDSEIDAIVNVGGHGVGNETTFILDPEDLQEPDDGFLGTISVDVPADPVLIKGIINDVVNKIREHRKKQQAEAEPAKTKKRQNTESKAAKKSKTKKS